MDLPTFRELLSRPGQEALAGAAALRPTGAGFLAAFEKLRKRHPAALAKAAIETVLLRNRARVKHALADRMYFTREALEQSSGDAVSRYRAERFRPFATVADLCCGIGADAIQLALAGCRVEAIDCDPLRLAMAEANAAAAGVAERTRFYGADVLTAALPTTQAAFVDSSRRVVERRFLDPECYVPALGAVLARFPQGFPIAAKIAPGVAWADIERYDSEVEFVSSAGELKECVLWFGPLRTVRRRATVLPDRSLSAELPAEPPPPSAVHDYVFDPDPSVIRAGLMGLLADDLGTAPVDHGVALLTGPNLIQSPFADCYRVEHAPPFHIGKLREYLRARGIGRMTMLKRAVDLDVNEVARKLDLDGPEHRHLILTRSLDRRVAIVAEKVGESPGAAATGP